MKIYADENLRLYYEYSLQQFAFIQSHRFDKIIDL